MHHAPHAVVRRWARAEALVLLATIPAFYLAVQSSQPLLSAALYLAAAAVSAGAAWTRSRAARDGPRPDLPAPSRRVGVLLVAALILSALAPPGDAVHVLILRLGCAALVVLRWGEASLPRPWRGELPRLLALAIGVFALCGLGFWWLEPTARSFGDGLWLAFTTAATVGYGDIVPSAPSSKIFAVFVVLMGLAVLSLVTASIAALWVQTEERRIEHELLGDLHHELRALRDEVAGLRRQIERR